MAGMHNWEIDLERQREIESLRAQLALARKALEEIASQKTSDQLLAEYGPDCIGDYEYAHDELVKIAQEALKDSK